MINQTHAPAVPAGPRHRRRERNSEVEFLMHAGSLGDFDVAAFAFAIHELMGQRGRLQGLPPRPSRIPEPELWATIEAGLGWLAQLHDLAPEVPGTLSMMENRLDEGEGPELLAALRTARKRAAWFGGLPPWLAVANVLVLAFVAAVATVVLLREPTPVLAGDRLDFATPAELRVLQERVEALQDNQAYQIERIHRVLVREGLTNATSDD